MHLKYHFHFYFVLVLEFLNQAFHNQLSSPLLLKQGDKFSLSWSCSRVRLCPGEAAENGHSLQFT